MRVYLIIIALLLSIEWAQAGRNSNGGTAGAMLRTGYGARALAMGNAVTALGGDPGMLQDNPAGLVDLERFGIDLTWHQLTLDRTLAGASIAIPLKPMGAIGLGIIHGGVSSIPEITMDGQYTGRDLDYGETTYQGVFSIRPGRHFQLGLNFSVHTASISQVTLNDGDLQETTLGLGVGLQSHLTDQLTLGTSLHNLNASWQWATNEVWEKGAESNAVDEFPLIFSIGTAYQFFMKQMLLTLDYTVSDRGAWDFNTGVEYRKVLSPHHRLALRGGRFQDDWTAGFGLEMRMMGHPLGLDYAVRFSNIDPGEVHVITWRFLP